MDFQIVLVVSYTHVYISLLELLYSLVGRAARISATGVTTSRLFYLAVMEGFGWVWYASSQYIIVAVDECKSSSCKFTSQYKC